MKAIRVHAPGGPEALSYDEVASRPPGPGEVRLRHRAIGVNYIDTYHRSGLYKVPLPAVLGREAAGEIVELGAGVSGWRVGERVAHMAGEAYAEEAVVPATALVRLPDAVSDEVAAAALLKGLTAHMLLTRVFAVRHGQAILVHAAAGGVGSLLVQWAKHLGAIVIGSAGGEEKMALARAWGCDHVIDSKSPGFPAGDFVAKVKDITGQKGVAVVYDAVGKDTFLASLDCLAPRGMMVSYGNASGPPPAIEPIVLMQKGSLFLTRPSLFHYASTEQELSQAAAALFQAIAEGAVRVAVRQRFSLRDAALAHKALEARATTGATVLVP